MSFSASAADERVWESSLLTTPERLLATAAYHVRLVWYPRLLDATPAQRKNWKIPGGGCGLPWPKHSDEDLSTEGSLRDARTPRSHTPVE